jgi:transcription elongation factor Elf1
MIQKPQGTKKIQKNTITYDTNLQCPQCHSKLEPCLINEKEMMLNCSNKNVRKINFLIFFLSF